MDEHQKRKERALAEKLARVGPKVARAMAKADAARSSPLQAPAAPAAAAGVAQAVAGAAAAAAAVSAVASSLGAMRLQPAAAPHAPSPSVHAATSASDAVRRAVDTQPAPAAVEVAAPMVSPALLSSFTAGAAALGGGGGAAVPPFAESTDLRPEERAIGESLDRLRLAGVRRIRSDHLKIEYGEPLGAGGFGKVFNARWTPDAPTAGVGTAPAAGGVDVAVKQLDVSTLVEGVSGGLDKHRRVAYEFAREATLHADAAQSHGGVVRLRGFVAEGCPDVGADEEAWLSGVRRSSPMPRLWIVMDVAPGGPLSRYLPQRPKLSSSPSPPATLAMDAVAQRRPLSLRLRLRLLADIAGTLARFHKLDVIFNDLTPSNVLLSRPPRDDEFEGGAGGDGSGGSSGSGVGGGADDLHALLSDFGLSHALLLDASAAGGNVRNPSLRTTVGRTAGTPGFRDPAVQASDGNDDLPFVRPGPWSDVYAFGMLAYATLAWRAGEDIAAKLRHDTAFELSGGRLRPLRPSLDHVPPTVPAAARDVIRACWRQAHMSRPTMAAVAVAVRAIAGEGVAVAAVLPEGWAPPEAADAEAEEYYDLGP